MPIKSKDFLIDDSVLENCVFQPRIPNPAGMPPSLVYPYHIHIPAAGGGIKSGWMLGLGFTVTKGDMIPNHPTFLLGKLKHGKGGVSRWSMVIKRDDLHLFAGRNGDFVDKYIEKTLEVNKLPKSRSEKKSVGDIIELAVLHGYLISESVNKTSDSAAKPAFEFNMIDRDGNERRKVLDDMGRIRNA